MIRLLTAAVAVPLLILLIMYGPAELLTVLALATTLGGFRELSALTQAPPLRVGYLVAALFTLAPHPWFPATENVVVMAGVLVGVSAVASLRADGQTMTRVATTVLGAVYIGAPLGCIVALRLGWPAREARLWIIFLLAVIMIGDAGAYYTGRGLGRHPLAPALSPKKTVEGLVGGITASVLAAVSLSLWWMPQLPIPRAAGLGLALALVGVLGDLFESLLKRSAGVKDTSSLLPGHGGLLDRIDSLLFAAPVLFLYVKWSTMK